jgi:CRISPR-associated exonuclease Cas4
VADGEQELLPISALQHLVFCPRQCALIHVERLWNENLLTAEGRVLHARQDEPGFETRHGVRTRRAVRVFSRSLGISGICDVVEEEVVDGQLRITPVETKHGMPKQDRCDEVQLCAQALCLEEMRGVAIDASFLFYAKTRRRLAVPIGEALRAETLRLIAELRAMMDDGRTPAPDYGPKCRSCSLVTLCLPKAISGQDAAAYLRDMMEKGGEPE